MTEENGNGEYREAGEENCGSAAGAAGDGAGPVNSVTWTVYKTGGITYVAGPATGASAGLIFNQAAVTIPGVAIYEPKSLEDGGIRVGEIVGWRCWRVEDGKLRSMFIGPGLTSHLKWPLKYIWEPDKPMDGDPTDYYGLAGVYAYKDRGMNGEMSYVVSSGKVESELTLYGEVSLWGNVVEHEHGYRAQFGRPKSLYCGPGFPRKLYEKVCATYGLEPISRLETFRRSPLGWVLARPYRAAILGGSLGILISAAVLWATS